MSTAEASPGTLLRDWRRRRRLSQLDLALEAGVSARHVSFLETGRSRPSREMVLHLSEQLDIPLRDRNQMLLAAGFAPAYAERAIDAPEMAPVREALDRILKGHEPYPAVVVDRWWDLAGANGGVALLTSMVAPHLLEPPANALRITLHPEGMAPHIRNLPEWRAHLLDRLRRQVAVTGDERLAALRDELDAYPGGEATLPAHEPGIAVPLRLDAGGAELRFLSTISTFGTAVDITLAELAIEAFFPADEETADYVRGATRPSSSARAGAPSASNRTA
ncbi:MAG TPA: helix-turn-helix transcriptional regulator [Solirubrobacteraceae bacterium]|nr:helix-turn-helix transcriptional regulator [Solirubrobacteraceae bacterium]